VPTAGLVRERVAAVNHEARDRRERALLLRYHRNGDPHAREALVERFLPLAKQLARRYRRGSEPMDDLVQVASLGLVKAIDRFDPERGTAFSSFAVPTILGELKRHFRDTGWSVRVPRDLQELAVRVERRVTDLSTELGRDPTVEELSESLGTPDEQILEALQAGAAHTAVSLDRPRGDEGEPGDTVADGIGDLDPGFELAEAGATLEGLMRRLPPREREVLRLRFAEDLTQSEIGERIGISQMHVSRLIRQSLTELRHAADEERGSISERPEI
jgi:RNA polymerase sigma-B factor